MAMSSRSTRRSPVEAAGDDGLAKFVEEFKRHNIIVPYYEICPSQALYFVPLPSLRHLQVRRATSPPSLDELRQSIIAAASIRRASRRTRTHRHDGVSRTVIREALRQLESEGLVAISPTSPIVRTLTVEEAPHLCHSRRSRRTRRALFTEQADQAQVARLERALSVVEKAYDSGDVTPCSKTKNNFYEVLFERKSETLASMLAILHGRIWRCAASASRTRTVRWSGPPKPEKSSRAGSSDSRA